MSLFEERKKRKKQQQQKIVVRKRLSNKFYLKIINFYQHLTIWTSCPDLFIYLIYVYYINICYCC